MTPAERVTLDETSETGDACVEDSEDEQTSTQAETLCRLALLVQGGDTRAELPLWAAVERFAHQQAHRTFVLSHGRGGVDLDDLMQAAFLAMLQAAKTYDPAAGAGFLHHLTFYLRTAFASLCGYRTSRRNPLDDCLSIDAPITGADGDDSDDAYADTLPDSSASEAFLDAEEHVFTEQLHGALDAAIDRHLSPRTAEVVRRLYWDGEQQTQVATDLGISSQAVAAQHQKGLRDLRLSSSARELGQFLCDGWHGTGLAAFQRRGMSSVELAVIRRDELAAGR